MKNVKTIPSNNFVVALVALSNDYCVSRCSQEGQYVMEDEMGVANSMEV